jgi:hypothetical protein
VTANALINYNEFQIEMTLFKISGQLLAFNSPIFSHMFSMPQGIDDIGVLIYIMFRYGIIKYNSQIYPTLRDGMMQIRSEFHKSQSQNLNICWMPCFESKLRSMKLSAVDMRLTCLP